MLNSVDPDQKQSDLGLHCLQGKAKPTPASQGLRKKAVFALSYHSVLWFITSAISS